MFSCLHLCSTSALFCFICVLLYSPVFHLCSLLFNLFSLVWCFRLAYQSSIIYQSSRQATKRERKQAIKPLSNLAILSSENSSKDCMREFSMVSSHDDLSSWDANDLGKE